MVFSPHVSIIKYLPRKIFKAPHCWHSVWWIHLTGGFTTQRASNVDKAVIVFAMLTYKLHNGFTTQSGQQCGYCCHGISLWCCWHWQSSWMDSPHKGPAVWTMLSWYFTTMPTSVVQLDGFPTQRASSVDDAVMIFYHHADISSLAGWIPHIKGQQCGQCCHGIPPRWYQQSSWMDSPHKGPAVWTMLSWYFTTMLTSAVQLDGFPTQRASSVDNAVMVLHHHADISIQLVTWLGGGGCHPGWCHVVYQYLLPRWELSHCDCYYGCQEL